MTDRLETDVRAHDGVAVIGLRGEVNAAAEAPLDAAFVEATRNDPKGLVLVFDEVSYINSTGIALIVGVLARARAGGRRVAACGLSEHYREIFEITRVADLMDVCTDEVSAIARASKEG